MTPARSRLLAVLALVALTLVLFGAFERYQVRQPQILQNGDFSNGLRGWRAAGGPGQLQLDQGILRIRAERAGQAPGVRQIIQRDPGMDHLRLSAWVRHTGVAAGAHRWNAARLLLAQRDSHGDPLWNLPHEVEQSRGDGPWRRVSEVFWLPSRVASVEVVAVLNQVVGQMQVRGLTLEAVEEHGAFTMARYALTAAWLMLLPWLIWPLYRSGPRRGGRLIVVLLAAVILAGVLTPQTAKIQLHKMANAVLKSDVVAAIKAARVEPMAAAPRLAKATPSTVDKALPAYQIWFFAAKLGHVGLFALLALAVTLTWRRQTWRLLCLYLTTFAVAAEILQLLLQQNL